MMSLCPIVGIIWEGGSILACPGAKKRKEGVFL
jgi:hypothetical protein